MSVFLTFFVTLAVFPTVTAKITMVLAWWCVVVVWWCVVVVWWCVVCGGVC